MPKPGPSVLQQFDGLLLDLDGCVYRGGKGIVGAVEFLAASDVPRGFITNNSARTAEQIAQQLVGFGLAVQPTEIFGSAQVAATLLQRELPAGAAVLVIGGDGLRTAVEAVGLRALSHGRDETPAAVVQGFSPKITWEDLAEAAYAVAAGAPWYASNNDWTIPLERGVAPGNGTLVSAVHTATGTFPKFAGKPAPEIFWLAQRGLGLEKPLVIGDRLDTDVRGAHAAGMSAALVLSGIDGPKALFAASKEDRPEFILEHLGRVAEPYPELRATKYGYRCGKAEVELLHSRLTLVAGRPGDIDVIRAASAVVWNSGLAITQIQVPEELLAR